MALYGRLFSLVGPSQFYVQILESRLGRIFEIPLYLIQVERQSDLRISKPFVIWFRTFSSNFRQWKKRGKQGRTVIPKENRRILMNDPSNGKPLKWKGVFQKSIKWKSTFQKTINCYPYTLQLIVSFFQMNAFTWSIFGTRICTTWSIFH